ncbi:hypothetical protein G7054_g10824 [Neopestalotiopsis clavispora]|nr:hypothetical protein G7054_g10824 [Neopestalotiopsis clavispora]
MMSPSGFVRPPGPSKRALESFEGGKAWDFMQQVKTKPQYDPTDEPQGIINLSGATNGLMRDWMKDCVTNRMEVIPTHDVLGYRSISGSPVLLKTMSEFFNAFFHPSLPVSPENIVAANGVTALIDLVSWTFCDAGDAILFLTPTFYMLEYDIATRTGVVGIPIATDHIPDAFGEDPESTKMMIDTLVQATDLAVAEGRCPRVLFICNPANPQGRSYSRQMLSAIAKFCAQKQIHLVSDEIYALSQFTDAKFCSVLSITESQDAPLNAGQMIHSIYGLSKDFDMGGLRMGFLVTRNKDIMAAISRVT